MSSKNKLIVHHKDTILTGVNKLLDAGGATIFLYCLGTKKTEVDDFRIFRGEFPLHVIFGMINSVATYMMLAQAQEDNNAISRQKNTAVSPYQDKSFLECVSAFPSGAEVGQKFQYPHDEKVAVFQQFNNIFNWGCDGMVLYGVTFDGLHVTELKGMYGRVLPYLKSGVVKAVVTFLQELWADCAEGEPLDNPFNNINGQNITFH